MRKSKLEIMKFSILATRFPIPDLRTWAANERKAQLECPKTSPWTTAALLLALFVFACCFCFCFLLFVSALFILLTVFYCCLLFLMDSTFVLCFCFSLLLLLSALVFFVCFFSLLADLGPLLASLGPLLVILRAILGRSWALCGRFCEALGYSWAALGAIMERHPKITKKSVQQKNIFWLSKGKPKGTQIEPQTNQYRRQKTIRKKHLSKNVLEPFCDDLGPFCDHSWAQKILIFSGFWLFGGHPRFTKNIVSRAALGPTWPDLGRF